MANNRADDAPRKEVKMYDPNVVVIIGLDTDDGRSHPLFDGESNDAPLIEADVQFTYEQGILQPVSGKRDGKRVLIVFGRGRTRQLREANKRQVKDGLKPWFLPVQIVLGDSIKMLAIKHGENSHRREQNPFVRAQQAYELAQQFPEDEAATILGLGLQQFKSILKLLDVGPAVKQAMLTGELRPTAAIELASLSETDQAVKLATIMATAAANGGKPSTRDVKATVREARGKAPLETPATRIKKVLGILDKLDDDVTKDDLWGAIKKIRQALK